MCAEIVSKFCPCFQDDVDKLAFGRVNQSLKNPNKRCCVKNPIYFGTITSIFPG